MIRPTNFFVAPFFLATFFIAACAFAVLSKPVPRVIALNPEQRLRADRLISVFENESLEFRYAYVENLHDGRGWTAGRAGFCTGCGDLLRIVEDYTIMEPENPLANYLPELRRLVSIHSGDTDGLTGFQKAWRAAAKDTKFCTLQDHELEFGYYRPSLELAEKYGLTTPLGLAAVYEAAVQHGLGVDPDSVRSILTEADIHHNFHVDLERFLTVRRNHLLNPFDQETTDAWRESVGRADEMLRIYSSGNLNLKGPIEVRPYEKSFTVP